MLQRLEHRIAARCAEHPCAYLFTPMPRIGTLNLPQIVAEVRPILERADNAEQSPPRPGVAPVTYASGHKRSVAFRISANRDAQQALTVFVDNSRHADPWAARIYADARVRGHRHPHAIRILARGWVRTIWQCWHTQTPYDPARRLAAERSASPRPSPVSFIVWGRRRSSGGPRPLAQRRRQAPLTCPPEGEH